MADQPPVYSTLPPGTRPIAPPIPTNPPGVPDTSRPTYATRPDIPINPTKPPLPPLPSQGGGGDNPEPAKPSQTQDSSDSRSEQTMTTSSSGQQQSNSPSNTGDNGGVTLQPGAPTPFRNVLPTNTSSPSGISGSVISGPMTAVVLTFAFLGALIIGLVAGFLIAKYTRLGGSRKRTEQKGQLTEQLRLLTESIGQRNDYNHYHHQQHPQELPFNLDRSYLQEDKLPHASFQGDLAPLYMNRPYGAYPTTSDAAAMDLSHPQLVPDQQSHYQNWSSAGTPLIAPGASMVSIRPAIVPTSAEVAALQAATAAASQAPHMGTVTTTLLPPDIEIDGPKDEWESSRAGSTISLDSKNVSASDLNEFERGRPQHRVPGEGEDSLFGNGLEVVAHNPHCLSRVN